MEQSYPKQNAGACPSECGPSLLFPILESSFPSLASEKNRARLGLPEPRRAEPGPHRAGSGFSGRGRGPAAAAAASWGHSQAGSGHRNPCFAPGKSQRWDGLHTGLGRKQEGTQSPGSPLSSLAIPGAPLAMKPKGTCGKGIRWKNNLQSRSLGP